MSNRNFRGDRKQKPPMDNAAGGERKKILIDESSPVVQEFRKYATAMNNRQDKSERLVKISRDITIESKRVIFLLHTILRSDPQKVLEEAESRLNKLIETQFKSIQTELVGEDIYQYLRNFTAGIQEFIEAYTFLYYLKDSQLKDWNAIDKKMEELCGTESSHVTLLTPTEYMLGVGDLSGELMRFSINNVATGAAEDTSKACCFVRDLYVGTLRAAAGRNKEMARKIVTLRQSLEKMEKTVYMLRVRGEEIPRHMIADVINAETNDLEIDEGFY